MEFSRSDLTKLITLACQDEHAELECKVLSGLIKTKDVADRLVAAIQELSRGPDVSEHRATFTYPNHTRVVVIGVEPIHKVCMTNSFTHVPLEVERKLRYSDYKKSQQKDFLDIPDYDVKITLRHEEPLRKDAAGSPMDPTAHIRILHRRSWTTMDGYLRFDMSLVKSRARTHKSFHEVLRQSPSYELELELVDKKANPDAIVDSFVLHLNQILGAFQGSPFLLGKSDVERYRKEFERMRIPFLNPITMERRHILSSRPNHILNGYTVTIKADGRRCFLVVLRDRRLVRITPQMEIVWTGLTALASTNHIGDVLDGEFVTETNTFYIFDVYGLNGQDTRNLPLLTSDGSPSRIGSGKLFVESLLQDFTVLFTPNPMKIETKVFMSGENAGMEKSIATLLDMTTDYPRDGLIFTPRSSPVAPTAERSGKNWVTVYKWKPPEQNSIDFLLKLTPGDMYDVVLQKRVWEGQLYVGRNPASILLYPYETMTEEYVPLVLPPDLRLIAENNNYIPTFFQPTAPRTPDAYKIGVPLDIRGVPVDEGGRRVEDNTIIECVYSTEKSRWTIMRTRYDKTHQYRVLGEPMYGNDFKTADSIWTNIHIPVTEQMIRTVSSAPASETFEDEVYYKDVSGGKSKLFELVREFHNHIKDGLFQVNVKKGQTLLELAMGRGGDMFKWKRSHPKLVVGIEKVETNLTAPTQGACTRYIREKQKNSGIPPALYIVGDMTTPFADSTSRYMQILLGTVPAPNAYLAQFAKMDKFDTISCQFAVHYACESEEVFRGFVSNLTTYGKGTFFGTCLDGASVYALLLGKTSHRFLMGGKIIGEFAKEYEDENGWTETFGKTLRVLLETFEVPVPEYLVPFGRMTEILAEEGYELKTTKLFSDHYPEQTQYTFNEEQRAFSFLHRSFAFQFVGKPEPIPEVTLPMVVAVEDEKKDEKKEEKKETKKVLKPKDPNTAPALFFGSDEGKGEWRSFANTYEAPIQLGDIVYPSAEHYVQWAKAKLFNDEAAAEKILKTKSGKAVKTLGDKVKDAVEETWVAKQDEVMKTALQAKYAQHPDLVAILRTTGDRPIGEANAREKYWSIGTSAETVKAADPKKWPGKNMLGKLLMSIREQYRT